MLEADGSPSMVQRAFVVPPHGHIGAIAPEQRQQVIAGSLVAGHYEQVIDRESAEEVLLARAQAAADAADQAKRGRGAQAAEAEAAQRPAPRPGSAPAPKKSSGGGYQRQGMAEALGKSVIRAAGSEAGRRLARGILGSLLAEVAANGVRRAGAGASGAGARPRSSRGVRRAGSRRDRAEVADLGTKLERLDLTALDQLIDRLEALPELGVRPPSLDRLVTRPAADAVEEPGVLVVLKQPPSADLAEVLVRPRRHLAPRGDEVVLATRLDVPGAVRMRLSHDVRLPSSWRDALRQAAARSPPRRAAAELLQHGQPVGDAPVLDKLAVTQRITSMIWISMSLPVAGRPMMGFVLLARALTRTQTSSPASTMSSMMQLHVAEATREAP